MVRLAAARAAARLGAMDTRPVPMWVEGAWKKVVFFSFEIDHRRHPAPRGPERRPGPEGSPGAGRAGPPPAGRGHVPNLALRRRPARRTSSTTWPAPWRSRAATRRLGTSCTASAGSTPRMSSRPSTWPTWPWNAATSTAPGSSWLPCSACPACTPRRVMALCQVQTGDLPRPGVISTMRRPGRSGRPVSSARLSLMKGERRSPPLPRLTCCTMSAHEIFRP